MQHGSMAWLARGCWESRLGRTAGASGFSRPVTVFTCRPASNHPAHACGQLGTQHGKQRLGQGQAVPTPAPSALGGVFVANGASLGLELALHTGSVPVVPRPAGTGMKSRSVAPGGRARERLVLVCKNSGVCFLVLFCFFFPGSVLQAAARGCKYKAEPAGTVPPPAERGRRRGEITVHVLSYCT